jgi:hypothetical protein
VKEYRIIQKILNVRQLKYAGPKPEQFENEINGLAKEGWEVKFSNTTVVPDDPAKFAGNKTIEAMISFYALLERNLENQPEQTQNNLPTIKRTQNHLPRINRTPKQRKRLLS